MEDTRVSIAGGCITLLIGLGFLAMLFGFRQVQPGEMAVVTRFGSVQGEARGEGWYIEPLTGFEYYNTREEGIPRTETAATKDLQDINVDIVVIYKFRSNLVDTYRQFGTSNNVKDSVLGPKTSSTLKGITVQYKADELLQKRSEVANKVKEQLSVEMARYNIDITGIEIKNIAFANAEYNDAIDRKQIAEQRTLQAKAELERAKLDAEKSKLEAKSLSEFTLRKMWIEKWNGQLPTYMGGEDGNVILPIK